MQPKSLLRILDGLCARTRAASTGRWEQAMKNDTNLRRSWRTPKIVRLGKIKDVAGAQGAGGQAAGLKT